MSVWIGTSGYNYPEWKGSFYPERLPAAKMLPYYAERFPTVEINYTFYRAPNEKILAGWNSATPERFKLTLKAPKRITHDSRLRDCAPNVTEFLRRAGTLGERLGVVLFQLPPYLKKDLPRLQDFIALLPAGTRAAFEFRSDSWHDDDVYSLLKSHGTTLCVTDTDEGDTPFVVTSDWGYVRLRRTHYDDDELAAWAARIASASVDRTYVYFMHEDEALGTKFARRLNELWAARG